MRQGDINSDVTLTEEQLRKLLEARISKLNENAYSRIEPNICLEIAYLKYLSEEADDSKLLSLSQMVEDPYQSTISQRACILGN